MANIFPLSRESSNLPLDGIMLLDSVKRNQGTQTGQHRRCGDFGNVVYSCERKVRAEISTRDSITCVVAVNTLPATLSGICCIIEFTVINMVNEILRAINRLCTFLRFDQVGKWKLAENARNTKKYLKYPRYSVFYNVR